MVNTFTLGNNSTHCSPVAVLPVSDFAEIIV
jgi:hypothetical protein